MLIANVVQLRCLSKTNGSVQEKETMVSSYLDGRITLTVGPRPGKRSVGALQNLGLTHCCTLLSAREGAEQVRDLCKKLGNEEQPCEWLWLPIEGGNIATLQATDLKTLMAELISAIEAQKAPHVCASSEFLEPRAA